MKKFKLNKKFKKLMKNPKKFFIDMSCLKPLFNYESSSYPLSFHESTSNRYLDPNYFGAIEYKNNKLLFSKFQRHISSKNSLATLFLQDSMQISSLEIKLSNLLLKINKIPFKKNYFYLFDYKNKIENYTYLDFFENKHMRSNYLKEFKNLIVVDPNNEFPFILRSFNLNINLIVILSEDYSQYQVCEEYIDDIDILFLAKEINFKYHSFRRKIIFNNSLELFNHLGNVIAQGQKREKNLFFPIHNVENIIENIDLYNESDYDILIKLDKNLPFSNIFADIIYSLNKEINSLLVRESIYYKYKSLLDNKDYKEFFRYSLLDGCRYEIL